jgi:phosphatidate phosphatase PAH1
MSLSNFVSNFNRIYGPFKEWYSKINPANMTGAIDVIVVQQQVIDGPNKALEKKIDLLRVF